MKKTYLLLLIVISCFVAKAQDDITVRRLQSEINRSVNKDNADTTPWKWLKGGSVNINGTQGSLRNWAAGGDKFSMALNSYFNYYLFYRNGKVNWDNNLDFNFGYVQSSSIGSRKNDDRLDILSKYGYNYDGRWFATGLYSFRTQFFDGYTFNGSEKTFSSTFFSPAYMIASAGVDYKPSANFSFFISPTTSRLVIVASRKLSDQGLYGVTPGEHTLHEFGAFTTINLVQPITDNIIYKGRLDLFSNYRKNPENIDVFMTNFFSFKINRFFTASYNLDLIYDDDVRIFGETNTSPSVQMKSLIGLGFQMKIK